MIEIPLLTHLEQCEPINQSWVAWMQHRAGEVQAVIARLRAFAALRPDGPVAAAVTVQADALQARLNRALARR